MSMKNISKKNDFINDDFQIDDLSSSKSIFFQSIKKNNIHNWLDSFPEESKKTSELQSNKIFNFRKYI